MSLQSAHSDLVMSDQAEWHTRHALLNACPLHERATTKFRSLRLRLGRGPLILREQAIENIINFRHARLAPQMRASHLAWKERLHFIVGLHKYIRVDSPDESAEIPKTEAAVIHPK